MLDFIGLGFHTNRFFAMATFTIEKSMISWNLDSFKGMVYFMFSFSLNSSISSIRMSGVRSWR